MGGENSSERVLRHRPVRLRPQGLLELKAGFVEASQTLERQAQIAVRLGIPGTNLESLLEMRDGVFQLPLRAENASEAVVPGRGARVQLERPAVTSLGFVEHSLLLQELPFLELCFGEIRGARDGRIEGTTGFAELSRLAIQGRGA